MPAAEWLVSQARDGRVGRPGHEHEPVRKLSPQELFEQGPAGAVALGPDVAVVEGEDVEHDERRRAGEREVLGPQVGGVDALLQGGEVQPSRHRTSSPSSTTSVSSCPTASTISGK
jgi:hypothetical protein